MIDKEVMKTLEKNIGRKVGVEYVRDGTPQTDKGILKRLMDFVNIVIEDSARSIISIPFVGYGIAIRKIIGENGEILYENQIISPDYNLWRTEKIEEVVAESFGIKTQTKASGFIERGKTLIKPELEGEWREFVSKNTKDFFSARLVEASLRVMEALSKGKSPEKIEDAICKMAIGCFQMERVHQVVARFHPRGKEFLEHLSLDFIRAGERLIKPKLKDEWRQFVSSEIQYPSYSYFPGLIEASLRVMEALSEGKSPEKAEAALYEMAIISCLYLEIDRVHQIVARFHPRGKEFWEYWSTKRQKG